jgi:hypothetical protein
MEKSNTAAAERLFSVEESQYEPAQAHLIQHQTKSLSNIDEGNNIRYLLNIDDRYIKGNFS